MNNRISQLALLVAIYVLVVQKIYAFVPLITNGDAFLLPPRIAWDLPQTWVPYVIGAVAVAGLVQRWGWAWWLTAAALLCELVYFLPRAMLWAGISVSTLATWIKIGWLLAIAWLLFRTRGLAGIGATGKRASKAAR